MQLILDSIDFAENRTKNGFSSGGELYFDLGDMYFPEEQWYDCVFLDLKIWLPRLISFGSNHADSCELAFMDGPYTARLSRLPNGSIIVSCYDGKRLITEKETDLDIVLKSVTACCRKFDRFLFENGKENQFTKEIKQLKHLLDT